ncbi:MAG: hypothetical protein JAY75_06210, partial [Candidatus Thiodiazotropha taylori]|nr:hypothetical protein [Candidatus Thiodiazotropha taylori]MCW4307803.1 hypothetical protein [Candidatus Thiodiazotropha endolucinida]
MHKSSMFPLKFDEKKIIKYMQEQIPILYRPAKGIGPTSYCRQPDVNPHAGTRHLLQILVTSCHFLSPNRETGPF